MSSDVTDILLKSLRTVDEKVYNRTDVERPTKEVFKQMGAMVTSRITKQDIDICDVGIGAGAFLYYYSTLYPEANLYGLDISEKLIDESRAAMPNCEYTLGNMDDPTHYDEEKFDVISCVGAFACLDDPQFAVANFLRWLKPGGIILIADAFNPDPIDVIMRYKLSDSDRKEWESGWNIFSNETIEKHARAVGMPIEIEWHDLPMPFPIKKTEDSMRTWTVQMDDEPHMRINGSCQILYTQCVIIRKGTA